jgi:hypothetical protein
VVSPLLAGYLAFSHGKAMSKVEAKMLKVFCYPGSKLPHSFLQHSVVQRKPHSQPTFSRNGTRLHVSCKVLQSCKAKTVDTGWRKTWDIFAINHCTTKAITLELRL